jgi:solute carrier family 25 folate transporter 32
MPFTPTKATDQALAGFTAGAVSTVALHPLDLLKTKLQVNEQSFRQLIPIMKSITRTSGIFGFYRGLSPNFVGATSSWGMYFFWYALLKDAIQKEKLGPLEHLMASGTAGLLTAIVTNPIWVVKTRMFTQSANDVDRYRGVFHGLGQLYKSEGFKGYYRGIVPAMIGVSHGALQFMSYEYMKQHHPVQNQSTLEYITMACISKTFATVCTYPYQVLKSRMQTQEKYLLQEYGSVSSTVQTIYKNEGLKGYYKGMGVNIIRVLPGTCITFAVYEALTSYFQSF